MLRQTLKACAYIWSRRRWNAETTPRMSIRRRRPDALATGRPRPPRRVRVLSAADATISIGHTAGSPASAVAERCPLAAQRHLASADAGWRQQPAARHACAWPAASGAARSARRCPWGMAADVGRRDRTDRQRRRDHDLPPRRRCGLEPAGSRGGCRPEATSLRTVVASVAPGLSLPTGIRWPRSSPSSSITIACASRLSHALAPGGGDQQRSRERDHRRRKNADADREQRRILEQVTANRGQPRRLQKPQRRKRKALGPALDEDVDQDRRGDRGEREQRAMGSARTLTLATAAREKEIDGARARGGVSVTISEY